MDTIEIRKATVEDLPVLARAHVRADWETYAPLFGPTAYRLQIAESEQRWQRALQGDGLLLIATDRRAIVGLGYAAEDRIGALYLLLGYHRRGVGKAILSRLLQFLHERGIAEAQLDVVAVNAKAIAFYSAQGARQVGRRVDTNPRGGTENLIFVVPTAKADGDRSRSSTG